MRNRLRSFLQLDSRLGEVDAPEKSLYAAIGLFCAAGGLTGYLFVPEGQAHAKAHSEALLSGTTIAADDNLHEDVVERARDYLRSPFKLTVGPWEFDTTLAELGVQVDVRSLERMVREAHDPSSPLHRFHSQHVGSRALSLPMVARIHGDRAEKWLLRIRDQVFQRESDARIDLRSGAIVPEQVGMALDVHATLDAISEAVFRGFSQLEAKVVRTDVKRTAAMLENLDLSASLGAFETRYNGLDADRSFNLRVAARHVDGLVLLPGETFDFNQVVGERSEANGFRPAPVIAGGELTDGVGGGTCQIAGTLSSAAFFAGLPFLERSPHTRPSSYLKLGLDATVSYPKLNLRFTNDLPYPVAFSVEVGGGRVRAEVRGSPKAQREVSFVRRIDNFTPYAEATRDDPSLPKGVRVLSQRGVPGFEVTSFRVVRAVGSEQVERERMHNVYPPTQQIWRVGTGSAAPEGYQPPKGDQHNEYRADEYLVMTKLPDEDGITEVVRREGRTGYPGWTAQEGMPQVVP